MFSRRHPYLFFILIFSSVIVTAIMGMTLLLVIGTKSAEFGKKDSVGVVEVVGVISDASEIISNIKQFREDDAIKAIVLRIDSPGGGVGPSQEIYREVRKTIKKKKVIASMGSVAASGGYYIAAGANGIIANPGTLTGSIAVIMGITNFRELLNKIGLVPVVIKSGEYKDIGSPVRDMTEVEKEILQGLVHRLHRQFVADISKGRKMDQAKVESLADGRIFSGEDAKNLGLIDRLGNLEDAIEWAGKLGGIKGKINVVYPPRKRLSLLSLLADSTIRELTSRIKNAELQVDYLYRPIN
jgi:protease-4